MSNSLMVSYTQISPNRGNTKNKVWTPERTHAIDTITIHCVAGQCTVEALGDRFSSRSIQASSNYGIGSDGRVGMYCEEKDRSWCSSNYANDNRAITIECASDAKSPYAINDKVYKSLIYLCADICRRNGIKELKWKADKSLVGQIDKQNMTVHMWFANKACPGPYIYDRLGQIAAEVNEKLGVDKEEKPITTKPESTSSGKEFKVRISIGNLNIRKGPGTDYSKVGQYTGIGIFTITEVKAGSGSKAGWGKLKSGAGWISLDFTTKV